MGDQMTVHQENNGSELYEQMLSMIIGSWVAQTVRVVADLSLADRLAEGTLTAGEIARREGSAPDTTRRLMRAGVAMDYSSTSAIEALLRRRCWRRCARMTLALCGQWPWR
jgi:hypothetical protein